MARQDRPNERLFVICGDTHHVPPAALEACVRGMEAWPSPRSPDRVRPGPALV